VNVVNEAGFGAARTRILKQNQLLSENCLHHIPMPAPSRISPTGPSQATRRADGMAATRLIAFVLLAVVAVRLLTLGAYPLGSTTEPRYAEIARKMLETGNWVTPWFDHGVPFWGKPPLSFWGSAATMGLLGVNEFAVRLAPFLAAMGTAGLFWAWPRDPQSRDSLPLGASVVMLSTVVGFIASAAVMTDMFMTLGTTLCMVAFWNAVNDVSARSPWRWIFFFGIAVGLLAKGPVATVITGLALGLWAVSGRGRIELAWRRLPWLRGGLVTTLLAAPWYLLAQQRTPGFLEYFIVGEHFERFTVSGWTGDLYGQGHAEPRGLIWWFGLGGFLPWTLVALLALVLLARSAGKTAGGTLTAEPFLNALQWQYLVAWTLAPLLFFTPARNILEAYVLPGLPAFALLTSLLALAAARRTAWFSRLWLLGLVCPALWAGWLSLSEQPELRSQRALIRLWKADSPLVYLGDRPLSANFYSLGRALQVDKPEDIRRWLSSREPVTLVLQDTVRKSLTAQHLANWRVVATHVGYTMLQRAADDAAENPSDPARPAHPKTTPQESR
jgi:4-amino-4-deoxy-L-arabinose transferase-like glycosyltransferase